MIMRDSFHDQELLTFIRQSDRGAFTELYNKHWEKLFVTAVKVLRDDDEAADVIQEVFVSLWTRREELTEIKSVFAWLYGAVRKKCLMIIRTNITRDQYLKSLSEHILEVRDTLNEEMAALELERILELEIDQLPPKMREIFILSRKEQLSHKEIAERLQISDKTVKKQINNVLKTFRVKLNDQSLISVAVFLLFRE